MRAPLECDLAIACCVYQAITTIKNNMQELKKDFTKTLNTFGMKYTTVMGTEVIEF